MENKHTRSVSLIDGHIEGEDNHINLMTDEDFIKALECCSNPLSDCPSCPLEVWDGCTQMAMKKVLNINARQKAEIIEKDEMLKAQADRIFLYERVVKDKNAEIEKLRIIVDSLKNLQSKIMEVLGE